MRYARKTFLTLATFMLLSSGYISASQAQPPYGAPPGYAPPPGVHGGPGLEPRYGGPGVAPRYSGPALAPRVGGPAYGPRYGGPAYGPRYGGPAVGPRLAGPGYNRPYYRGRKKSNMPWDDMDMPWSSDDDDDDNSFFDRDWFVDEFTDAWDEMINAPADMGEMPGGWYAPTVSMPNPVTVGDEFATAAEDFPDEMKNIYDANRERNRYGDRDNRPAVYDSADTYDAGYD